MKKDIEDIGKKSEQKESSKPRYYVRLIDRTNGQPNVKDLDNQSKALGFADENSNKNFYAHVYDRKQANEKGEHKKIYTTAPEKPK